MKKIRVFALIIIAVFIFNLWSGMIYYAASGGRNLGKLTKPIIAFSEFPRAMVKSLKNLQYLNLSQTYIPVDPNFSEINTLAYDVFTLHSYWNTENNTWTFDLLNLRNDSIVFTWRVGEELIEKMHYDRPFRDFRPLHSLLTADKSLIINFAHLNNLLKIDSTSTILWKNTELGYHHSMEFDGDGHIWVCAENPGEYTLLNKSKLYSTKVRNLDRVEMTYKDDLIVKLNAQTGEIISKKSVSDLLIENSYSGLLFNSVDYRGDPLHLNDIQPALDSTAFWHKGDLFLSLRNLSTIVLYRPSTNKVHWLSQGPFLNQHDVDIISEREISIFNNNMNWAWGSNYTEPSTVKATHILRSNEIITYDFTTKEFSKPYLEHFMNERIKTRSEGRVEYLSNGDVFVEEQNDGKIYILGSNGILLKKMFKTSVPGKIHMPNWLRVYESLPFAENNTIQ